ARYGVEHWKNPHAKIFYIRKQKEPGKPEEEIYSNSKIKVNLTAPTITFPGIKEHDMCSIIYEPMEEEIEKRLKHRRQVRRWEMYMNRRPVV
ncbi:hypothetical protein Tco_0426736, partial [Tanacetum coccineum]